MKNTQGVTMDMMKNHGAAVNKEIKRSLKVLDMPYKTYDNKIDLNKFLLVSCFTNCLRFQLWNKL